MIHPLGRSYRISTDKYNVILEKFHPSKIKEDGTWTVESWKPLSYHADLASAARRAGLEITKKSATIEEALTEISDLCSQLEKLGTLAASPPPKKERRRISL